MVSIQHRKFLIQNVITFWFGTANIEVFRYEFENIILKLCTYVFNTLLYGIILCTHVKIFFLGVHMKSNDPPISHLFEVLLRLNRKFLKAIIKFRGKIVCCYIHCLNYQKLSERYGNAKILSEYFSTTGSCFSSTDSLSYKSDFNSFHSFRVYQFPPQKNAKDRKECV